MNDILLAVDDLSVDFTVYQNRKWPWSPPHTLHAVNDISFALHRGKTLGIVGESGCGKSTLIRSICGLVTPSAGNVSIDGIAIEYTNQKSLMSARRKMQMIFQDPIASLNPRMTIAEIVQEPLQIMFAQLSTKQRIQKANAMLDRVGIAQANLGRYPHEFSGGQCQRIGIARALVSEPELLLCDEPVSALDVSIQAQVVNLLVELQAEMGLTMIFVAHDLGVVHHISDDILVMYLGGMMEYAPADIVIKSPRHPYTQALLSAVPVPDPNRHISPQILVGDLPSPIDPPIGCLFSTRCPKQQSRCLQSRPKLEQVDVNQVACYFAQDK